ncbi:MAG: hypothetical protein LW731_13440, partial [Oxalobacteraceae bacterium]|nr:hypothetical protein [Oxalobacteraceae bacterium]
MNPDDSLNWHFLLTAMAADQQTASAGFTDAAGSTNKVYQHWADGDAATGSSAEWNNNILNANKSDYFEGEVIPHVFIYKASSQAPLENGQSYSFNVTYNYYQQNTDALGFDYLTTFNTSRTPGQLGVTNPAITPTLDSSFTNNGGFTEFGIVSPGIYTVDANITNVSGITTSGSGNLDHTVTITFTYTGATTSNGVAEIYYGLHLAGPSATDKGASAWTGGSLQTTVDIGGSGATSIQLSPAAIIAGSISGVKFNDLDGDGIRDAGEFGIDGVTIYLDLNNDGQLNGNDVSQITASGGLYAFSVTPDANKSTTVNDPYIVREVVPEGWTQTTAPPAPLTISATTPTYTNINFGNRENIAKLNLVKTTGDGADGAIVDGDGVNVKAGSSVVWTYTVTNVGNVDVAIDKSEGVKDDNGTAGDASDDFYGEYLGGDANNDGLIQTSETWVFSSTGTAVAGAYGNSAVVAGKFNEADVTATDTSSYFGKPSTTALIAPTSTTIQQYLSGTAQTFQDYYSYQGGVIQYSVKAGKISQTNPGVFFYFTGSSGSIKGVDANNDSRADALSLTIDQSRSGTTSMFGVANNGIQLYKVNDLNGNGVIDATDTVTTVSLKSNQIIFGSGATAGDVTINFTPDQVGTMYMLSVKYNTGSVVGNAVSSPSPTVHYDFATKVNGNQVENYAAGVDLAPKPVTAMMLEGESGDGAKAVKAVQI